MFEDLFKIKPNVYPAVLSFLLPGLGQLYQSHWKKSLLFFTAFNLTLYYPWTQTWALAVCFTASFEVYVGKTQERKSTTKRDCLYGFLALLAFFYWMALLAFPYFRL